MCMMYEAQNVSRTYLSLNTLQALGEVDESFPGIADKRAEKDSSNMLPPRSYSATR